MKFTDFSQIVSFMNQFANLEKNPNLYNPENYRLDRMKRLAEHIGNPQNCYRIIHIAGSKGKGSTAAFIASGLDAAGFTTGLYMSPHVSDYRERFTLAGKQIDERYLIETGNMLASMMESFEEYPTAFEMYTAFAFLLFKKMKCDFAVIETGLGGRLDATNIVTPQASVITPIELEHTDLLGNTIKSIAGEKAKIIKQNVPVFSSIQKPDAFEVFENEAKQKNSSLHYLPDFISGIQTKAEQDRQRCIIRFRDGSETSLMLRMLGKVQAENCALAILVLKTLNLYYPEKADKAFEDTVLPGRMEKADFKRTLYLDGAHTSNSMENLLKTFRELHPGKKGICIFGSVKGKNHSEMASLILKNFNTVVICRPGTFKPSDVNELYDTVKKLAGNQTVVIREKAEDAIEYCLENSDEDTPILACGSFYLAGVIKEALK